MENKARVALPVDHSKIEYNLNNTGLNGEQFDTVSNLLNKNFIIHYKGSFEKLYFLMEQLCQVGDKNINLIIDRLDNVEQYCILPIYYLSPSIKITFFDEPGKSSNFYTYLINTNDVLFKSVEEHMSCYKEQMATERKIQEQFLKQFRDTLISRRKVLKDYTNTQLMDVVFKYVYENFPYDNSIVEPGTGRAIPGLTYQNGGYAAAVYQRGKGICEGRSKLIKLFANNKVLQLPCYLVDGKFGSLLHCWNEFIDENGNVIEYDASHPNGVCKLNELPSHYQIENHEPEVEKCLRQIR